MGCNLCSLVCPVENCIKMVRIDDGTEHASWFERTLADDIPTTFNDDRAGGKNHFIPQNHQVQ